METVAAKAAAVVGIAEDTAEGFSAFHSADSFLPDLLHNLLTQAIEHYIHKHSRLLHLSLAFVVS